MGEVRRMVEEGWEYVAQLPDGSVVMRYVDEFVLKAGYLASRGFAIVELGAVAGNLHPRVQIGYAR